MATQSIPRLSIDEYLALEEKSEFRSEYADGTMFAMALPTRNHERIVTNALVEVGAQLRGRPCEATVPGTRLYIPLYEAFTYPDIVVTCGRDRLFRDGRTLTDATAVIEVLSPSTSNYDRSVKFDFYRSLPSFAEFLVLQQDEMGAELRVRQPSGSWLLTEFTGPDSIFDLASIGCRVELRTFYARVEFGAGASSTS